MEEGVKEVQDPGTITNGDNSSSRTNVFSTALKFWTQIDLPSIQSQLDKQGIEIREDQKESLNNRKNLASKTKEFRKLPDEDKLEQLKGVLKLYQNEIDSLTTKQKKIESYFFDFYREIAEAPDPKPLLELSLDSVINSGEVEELKEEISKLTEQLSKKADYEQLKQRLIRNEQKSAELLSSKLKSKDDEYKAIIDEKEKNWLEKEKFYEKQKNEYNLKIEELKTSNEVTELQLNSQSQFKSNDNNDVTVMAELEMVSRDAEFSKQRLLEVEKRNENLRKEISNLKNNSQLENVKEEYTKKILELEGENSLLIAELDQARRQINNLTTENANKLNNLNTELVNYGNEIKDLKNKLYAQKDYEEIKTELHYLRKIEFDDEEEDEDEGKDTKDKVDSVLMKKNKALNDELVQYRSQHEDLINKINGFEQQVLQSNEEIEKLNKLNQKLEDDLFKFNDNNKFNDNMSLISGYSKKTNEDSSSILPIITKQRDRFRDRNNELEEELKRQTSMINDFKRTINQLRQDNEELYERTRFLASSQSSTKRNTLLPKPNMDLENNNYRNNYETKLHPIEQFRIKEQERISSRLSPFERIFISLTRAVLATRTTRMLFLGYCVGLHFIVMIVTIYSTSLNAQLIPEVGMNTSTGGKAHE